MEEGRERPEEWEAVEDDKDVVFLRHEGLMIYGLTAVVVLYPRSMKAQQDKMPAWIGKEGMKFHSSS